MSAERESSMRSELPLTIARRSDAMPPAISAFSHSIVFRFRAMSTSCLIRADFLLMCLTLQTQEMSVVSASSRSDERPFSHACSGTAIHRVHSLSSTESPLVTILQQGHDLLSTG